MKFIKTFIYISITLLTLSCTVELDNEVVLPATSEISGTIAVSSSVASPGFPLAVTVTLPQTFNKAAKVKVKAVGADLTETTATLDIAAGNTTATGNITMPAASLSGIFSPVQDFVTVQVLGLSLFDEVTDDMGAMTLELDTTDTTVMTSNIATVSYYERVQWPYGAGVVAGRMTGLLDWTNSASNDLDMYMKDASGALVESAESGSRWETDIFNSGRPDGVYTVEIGVWIANDTDIDWKLFFVHPDQTTITVLEGSLSGLTLGQGANANIAVATITQTTDADGNETFAFAKL